MGHAYVIRVRGPDNPLERPICKLAIRAMLARVSNFARGDVGAVFLWPFTCEPSCWRPATTVSAPGREPLAVSSDRRVGPSAPPVRRRALSPDQRAGQVALDHGAPQHLPHSVYLSWCP